MNWFFLFGGMEPEKTCMLKCVSGMSEKEEFYSRWKLNLFLDIKKESSSVAWLSWGKVVFPL